MSKHTKGPWTLEAGRSFVTASGRFHLAYGTEPGTGRRLFDPPEELDANARLIAAAPDLLASCIELLNCIDPARDWQEAKRARTAIAAASRD